MDSGMEPATRSPRAPTTNTQHGQARAHDFGHEVANQKLLIAFRKKHGLASVLQAAR